MFDWPTNSPDLNPIENLWGIVKRKMKNKRPKNADELKATVKETLQFTIFFFFIGLMKYSNLLRIGGFLLNVSQNHHN